MKYLIHQDPDFTPVGVWTDERTSFYPTHYADREQWGASVVGANRDLPWDEFAERLAESFPSPKGSWNILDVDDEYPAERMYQFALDQME